MEKSDFKSAYDRESLLHVRDEYDGMKKLIGQLSSKLTTVSSHIEKEFLSAYRVHMLSVQEELRSLKGQVVDAEVALNDDEEVSRLEHEVTWFSDESARLRSQSDSMRKDMQHVVTRIEALREQREYLNEQLKTTLKRSKIMEAEIEVLTEADLRLYSDTPNDSVLDDGKSNGNPETLQRHTSNRSLRDEGQEQRSLSRQNRGGHSTSSLPSIGGTSRRLKPKQKQLPPMDVLVTQKRSTKDLGNIKQSAVEELDQLVNNRLNIELDLEAALRSVFKDIIDRKVNAVSRTNPSKDNDNNSEWNIVASAGGITGLGIAHFSDTDRVSAMTTFLGQPNNFAKILEALCDELESY